MINTCKLDGVIIVSSSDQHCKHSMIALNKGLHVFCEKPPCFTVSEMHEIIAEEKKSQKKLMYGFNHRHHDAIRAMKTFVDSHGCRVDFV